MSVGYHIATISGEDHVIYETAGGGGTSHYIPLNFAYEFAHINDDGTRCVAFMNYRPGGDPSNEYAFLYFDTNSSYTPYDVECDFKSENFNVIGEPICMLSKADLSKSAAWVFPYLIIVDGSGNTIKKVEFTSGLTEGYVYNQHASIGRDLDVISISFAETYSDDDEYFALSSNVWLISYDLNSGNEIHATCFNQMSDEYEFQGSAISMNDYGHIIVPGGTMRFEDGDGGCWGKFAIIYDISGNIVSQMEWNINESGYAVEANVGSSKTSNEIFAFYFTKIPMWDEGIPEYSENGFFIVDKNLNFLYSDSSYISPSGHHRTILNDHLGVGVYMREDVIEDANPNREHPIPRGTGDGTDNFVYGNIGSGGPGEWRPATTEEVSGAIVRILSVGL